MSKFGFISGGKIERKQIEREREEKVDFFRDLSAREITKCSIKKANEEAKGG